MRIFYTLTLCLFTVFLAFSQQFAFNYKGISRGYYLHLPTGYSASTSYPLVLNFHGLNMTGNQERLLTGMDATSDANKFIVVYPDGLNKSWNAGLNNETVDDIGFINALLDSLIAKYNINTQRIYATGFSMGGFFSYRLGCHLSNRIAAIAPVAATVMGNINATCATKPVPVAHFHGVADEVVNYNGVAPSINFWVTHNKCTAPAKTTPLTTNITLTVYGNCAANTEVRLYKINGWPHNWPNTSSGINGNNEIWDFFNRFTLNGLTALSEDKVEEKTTFSIFPNPLQEQATLEFTAPINGIISLTLRDLVTKVEIKKGYSVSAGLNSLPLDLKGFTPGIYLLTIESNEYVLTKKLVVR